MESFKKWLPFLLGGVIVITGMILMIVTMRPNWGADKAKYVNGREELELKGVRYRLINDVESETYVGSGITDVLKTERGERAGSIVSGGIMTVAVLYHVKDDAKDEYLIDSVGRIYVKSELADAAKVKFADPASFPVYRILGASKEHDSFTDISAELFERISAYASGTDGSVRITEKAYTEDFSDRREVFAFTEDLSFYRACGELFLYKNEVYVTTGFIKEKDTKDHKAVLLGNRLPDELQGELRSLWPQ